MVLHLVLRAFGATHGHLVLRVLHYYGKGYEVYKGD